MRLKAVLLRERRAVVGHRHRQEMILDVGIGDARAAADEAAGLEMIGGAEAVLAQQPAQRRSAPSASRIDRGVQRDRLLAGHLKIEFQMILQILADARQVLDDSMPSARSSAAGPTPESFKQLRRIDRAAARGSLRADPHAVQRAAAPVFEAIGAPARRTDARRQRVGQHLEVRRGASPAAGRHWPRCSAAPARPSCPCGRSLPAESR
jgi:hypothetical protein